MKTGLNKIPKGNYRKRYHSGHHCCDYPLCPLIIEDEDPFTPSKGWAEMIKKVYEIDILSFLWLAC